MPQLSPEIFDADALNRKLDEGIPPIKAFRETLKAAHANIEARFDDSEDIAPLVFARARVIDQILCRAWQLHLPNADDGIALIAVGGYGRGELHPGSDIDIMVLLRENNHDSYREGLEKLVMFFWDIGLEVGHSVRSLSECVHEAEQDITVATNLMEARLLTGPQDLFEQMREITGPDHTWSNREFFSAKWREQIERHRKFDDTSYNLEPNVKEGPGGLRDIQMIGWVAKRYFNAESLHELVTHAFLTEKEYQTLIEGQNFLWRVRFALHVLTHRREDRLLFDYQRTLAERLGYRDATAELAVEQFMKRYYRTIFELNRLNDMLLQLFQEAILYEDDVSEPVLLNKRFQIRKGFLEARYPKVFQQYPFALLELFLLMEQHPEIKGVRAATIRLVRDHHHLIDDTFRNDLRNRSLFMEILRQPQGLTRALRRMNRYGILAKYLPAFGNIVGLMQYDLFHVFTVDEHTLTVVRNLRRLMVERYSHELPFCSQLMQAVPKPEVLYLAALFHDIAKGRGGDHSELGAQDVIEFCGRHNISSYDTRLISWLVRNHLLMSTTAQRKDTSDPDVINEFASNVGDQTHLDHLYLLTIADVRATSPKLWTSWKSALLFELYTGTKRALRRGLENPICQQEFIDETKEQAREYLQKEHVEAAEINALWEQLNDEYFLRHTAEEIAWHTQAIIENQGRELPLILVQQEARRGGTEIFIHAPLQNHLFATTTRTLDQMGLTVVDARIIKSKHSFTFDTYIVLEESGAPITSSHRIREILDCLRADLGGSDNDLKKLTRRTPRQLKHFDTPTQVSFSQDLRNQRTVLELFAADRPGLLSRVAEALKECDVYLNNAKIATIGERTEDVFFITDKSKHPITEKADLDHLRQRIIHYLDS